MLKRILSAVLVCMITMAVALPVRADETEFSQERKLTIVNVGSLEKLAEECRLDSYSQNLVISLRADLDLSDSDFKGFPIFCGRFEGNGHTIRGLNLKDEGSVQGFFRYLTESAVVSNLHLEGTVQPKGTGSHVGGFVGKNSGAIYGCSFTGTVSGKENIGSIAGENMVTGIIERCVVNGNVYGAHFVGGIVGKNAGTIRLCKNCAAVNETSRKNQVELTDITLDSLFHSEAANTVTDVGGIAGNNTGMIRDCVNLANIGYTSMGYNIGGIAGTQSGTVLNCDNRGEIFGRKEIGGIVGQMEPSAVMKFEEDALQILNRQLNAMGSAIDQASSNLQGAGESIVNEMYDVYDYVYEAGYAVEVLLPNPENPVMPDEDTLQAARNNIGSSLYGMVDAMEDVSDSAYNALGKVSTNLQDVSDQINAMRRTIGNISENTGGSLVDLSDEDTEQDLSGKVADCCNYGNVQGDLNCGGITGAIALENDLDVEEDWLVSGENSLNFESELRAVILNCENLGNVSVGKQNAGGIVGLQSLGLVRMSRNAGKIAAEQADYVGGISGNSMGFIRNSYANGEIFGKTYVGGIAGVATIATDCRALVRISGGVEKQGAILGSLEENRTETENPVSENYYLPVQKDCGAIDGISYEGKAQPLTEEAFFCLENLPEMFRHVTLTFRYGNGTERKFTLDFASSFPEEWIPQIPPKDDRQSYWKGMESADLSAVCFDMVFEQAYTDQITVLESPVAKNAVPILLVQGVFSENATLAVEALEEQLPMENKENLLEMWQFRVSEPESQKKIRLLIPENADVERIRIMLRGADNSWRAEEHHVLGRYAVVSLDAGDDAIAVIQAEKTQWLLYTAIAAGFAVLAVLLIRRKGKKEQ